MKYKIKYINLAAQYKSLSSDIKHEFKKIFKNSSFILRKHVTNFENIISKGETSFKCREFGARKNSVFEGTNERFSREIWVRSTRFLCLVGSRKETLLIASHLLEVDSV